MSEKKSLKQSVYTTLKDAILARKLPPGKQIVENVISESLNISRTPIRSAIDLLAADGLVEIIPNKGAFVINPSLDEVLQAYELRKELEIMAVQKSLDSLAETDFAGMEKIVTLEKEALYSKDLRTYVKANESFHLAITKRSGNIFLNEFIEKLINQTSIYLILFDIFFEENSPQPYGYKEHLEIVELMREKNVEALKKTLERHFDNAIKSLDVQTDYEELDEIFK
ncbi:MAG TPA: GntR family transcriptional regulator [Bacillus bacterium]|uniref:GntR family transcriptional regulator n=1 Tax=Siminovitchia fordii TaxID=254759 RepID=A0ABQ4K928_9BACI|nr:GntR family transcriptional regulator [Siminovitchia fordii]GIN22222.1 GntR family transcriptional regulator [Siminovitchia fordii]HBZ08943.1 GntR family transcriptional regulator [Bacillus sp. (in: firmicutes)]